ncbi:hypothetical protein [Gracilibacillus dipsosauri]|uniref:hypothetical protein n=1 Tax=Gracilibacillus dipsosauri TaxID=178340 RepID=UPI0024096BCC
MIASVNHNVDLNQLKQQYFEAQRTNDLEAMNEAKRQALQTMNEPKQAEDTVEISQQAMNYYQNNK